MNIQKTYIKNDLKKVYLVLEGEEQAHEDYQAVMLQKNEISGVLKTDIRYVDNRSHYYYDISGKTAFGILYEKTNLNYEQMKQLVENLMETIQNLQKYMLDGNCLLLEPEMIFKDKNRYYFCYYPSLKKNAREEFHRLTEFFVREVDYKDEAGVHFAYTLHKTTMEENYSLDEIMQYLLPQEEKLPEIDYTELMETAEGKESVVEEKKDRWAPVRKLWDWAKRIYLEDEDEDL